MRHPVLIAGHRMMLSSAIALFLTPASEAQEVAPVNNVLTFSSKGAVQSAASDGKAGAGGASTSSGAGSAIQPGEVISPGNKVMTGKDSATSLVLGTAGSARMGPESELYIPTAKGGGHSLGVSKGSIWFNIPAERLKKRNPTEFRLKTPAAVLGVKGTKFFAITHDDSDIIGVNEGSVRVTEPASKKFVDVLAGQAVTVSAGKISPPRPISDEESRYGEHYDAAALINTPMSSIAASPGIVSVPLRLDWSALEEFNGTKLVRKSAKVLPKIRPDGGVVYQWTPPLPRAGKISHIATAPLIWRVEIGAKQDQEPIALSCKIRSKLMQQGGIRVIEEGGARAVGNSFLVQPKAGDDEWVECLVSFPRTESAGSKKAEAARAKASYYLRNLNVELNMQPEKHTGAVLDVVPNSGAVEVTDLIVLSLPPMQ